MKKNKCPKCGEEVLVTHIKCDNCGEQLIDDFTLKNVVSVMTPEKSIVKEEYYDKKAQVVQIIVGLFFLIVGVMALIWFLSEFFKNSDTEMLLPFIVILMLSIIPGIYILKDYQRTKENHELLLKEGIIEENNKEIKKKPTIEDRFFKVMWITLIIVGFIILFLVMFNY